MNEFDNLWKMMDRFMDCECDMDFAAFEREFDKQFAAMEAEFYREFFHTLKKTVELCKTMECCPPPETLHITLFHAIEQTPQKKPPQKRRKKN